MFCFRQIREERGIFLYLLFLSCLQLKEAKRHIQGWRVLFGSSICLAHLIDFQLLFSLLVQL